MTSAAAVKASVLSEGSVAPDFTLPSDGGDTVSLSDFAGKKIVLYFYPKDDTPGCTVEAQDFAQLHESFAASDAVILGVSKDSVKKHDKFKAKHCLPFALLSDDAEVCERYGVWVEKSMYGKKYMGIERSTFLIDTNGKISHIWNKVKVSGHAQDVLDCVKSL
ncbi:MAG: thioredoxin-dependent thiol peroxidase [Alphaproteobacteria bacterium]|nr:thioredoxin-dependent thiol peroxidase [Alphaproteobacteria bacterium]